MLVPTVFMKDIRSLNKTDENLCYYIGCTECRKQLDENGNCNTHGQNEGKKIYGVQVTLQDPEHKIEVAMWEDCLKGCCSNMQTTGVDMDADDTMEKLAGYLRGRLLCARFSFGVKKKWHRNVP